MNIENSDRRVGDHWGNPTQLWRNQASCLR